MSRMRVLAYRLLGVRIGKHSTLRNISIPRNWQDVALSDYVALDDGVVLLSSGNESQERILIGERTYINRFTIIDASESITIGSNCRIGPQCFITDADHGTQGRGPVAQQDMVTKPVVIERDVWIGANVVILKGVTIGEGAVVAAGTVVNKDVESFNVVAGVPAERKRIRNDE